MHVLLFSDDEKDVTIGFTIRKIIPWLMWWPFRALSGGGNAIGFFRCDPAHLILRLLPGAGGVLPTCEESVAATTEEDLRNCIDIFIPWIQV